MVSAAEEGKKLDFYSYTLRFLFFSVCPSSDLLLHWSAVDSYTTTTTTPCDRPIELLTSWSNCAIQFFFVVVVVVTMSGVYFLSLFIGIARVSLSESVAHTHARARAFNEKTDQYACVCVPYVHALLISGLRNLPVNVNIRGTHTHTNSLESSIRCTRERPTISLVAPE